MCKYINDHKFTFLLDIYIIPIFILILIKIQIKKKYRPGKSPIKVLLAAGYILYVEKLQKDTEKEQMQQKQEPFLKALVGGKNYINTLTETSKKD